MESWDKGREREDGGMTGTLCGLARAKIELVSEAASRLPSLLRPASFPARFVIGIAPDIHKMSFLRIPAELQFIVAQVKNTPTEANQRVNRSAAAWQLSDKIRCADFDYCYMCNVH